MARRRISKPPHFRMGPDFEELDLNIGVSGFKAIQDEISVRIAPLTIISGANSGGKSSFMQPLLLMKQTLDASFDPGSLLLHGSNAKFTDRAQTLSRGKSKDSKGDRFSVKLTAGDHRREVVYVDSPEGFTIGSDTFADADREVTIRLNSTKAELQKLESHASGMGELLLSQSRGDEASNEQQKTFIAIRRDKCFLEGALATMIGQEKVFYNGVDVFDSHTDDWVHLISGIIHVPGLRGNPEREYPRAAVGKYFPGTFDQYVASVILDWGERGDPRIAVLSKQMEQLGLTWKIFAKKKNDATVEVLVGRLPHGQQGGAHDLVSIADVGFGVSQTLPVVVSLLSAAPGQIVYIEQPEIHLHPRAQVVLGSILVEAANRGVKVIAETHSSLMIRSIQTEIALSSISAKAVSLNWFNRDAEGHATLSVADIDEQGRFGDWPLDFDDVAEEADVAYIEAIRTGRDS